MEELDILRGAAARSASSSRAHCLQEAVRDTSFAAAKADGESKELLVNWSFPVPWPKSDEEIVGLAIDTADLAALRDRIALR